MSRSMGDERVREAEVTEQKDKKRRRWGECECCGFETWIEDYEAGPPGKEVVGACDVCAGTWISNVCKHPYNYGCDVTLYRSLGYVANMILAGQRKRAGAQERWDRVFRALSRLYDAYYKRPMQTRDLTEKFLAVETCDALKELMEAYDAWLD